MGRRLIPSGMTFGKYRSWKRANERRIELIVKSNNGKASCSEMEELEVLQKMAGRIVSYNYRPALRKIQKIERNLKAKGVDLEKF